MGKALGLIETKGLTGAIEAIDVACKTADVEVLNKHLVKGGIVTVEIVGDVGAVKVAVESAKEMTKRLGVYMGSHVIPRPDETVYNLLKRQEKKVEKIKEKIEEVQEIEVTENISEEKNEKEFYEEKLEVSKEVLKENKKTKKIKK